MAQADGTNPEMDALREKLVREALDDALRMYSPQRRSILGGLMAAVGIGFFAKGDGLPHGGVIKSPANVGVVGGGFCRVGEAGPEMIVPHRLARKFKLDAKDGFQAVAAGPITITVRG